LKEILNQNKITDNQWEHIKYKIFNTPDPSLYDKPYIERHAALQQHCQSKENINASINDERNYSQHIEVIPFTLCENPSQIGEMMEDILNKGGEGIVIHQDAPYIPAIRPIMWKYKVLLN
jgi:ATP-dependent DNA ligase